MFGPQMYELARYLHADRLRAAEARRVANFAGRNRGRKLPQHGELEGRWTLEWAGNGFTGTQVTLTNEDTGERLTGRHPFDWDEALGNALEETGLLA